MARRIIDLSPILNPETPVWPGDTPFTATRTWALGEDGSPVNVSRVTLSTHTGAHADAPLHYDADGGGAGELALEPYIGPAWVIHAIAPGAAVSYAQLKPSLQRAAKEAPETLGRILVRTYERAPQRAWDPDFAAIEAKAIERLSALGCRLIGVDTPSLDPQGSKTMEAHAAVRAADMRILEGLILDEAEEGAYELIAPPLKLGGLDAAPVRAVLRTLD